MKKKVNLVCPHCDKKQKVEMPANACLAMHECIECKKIITPKEGECCVVCSWSDEKCPVSNVI